MKTTLLLVLLSVTLSAQLVWEKTYGNVSNALRPLGSEELPDGRIRTAFADAQPPDGHYHLTLRELDPDGTETPLESGLPFDPSRSVLSGATVVGGGDTTFVFVVMGEMASFVAQSYTLEGYAITAAGAVRLFSQPLPDADLPWLAHLDRTATGDFILAGYFTSGTDTQRRSTVLRYDARGNRQWARGYGLTFTGNWDDYFQDLVVANGAVYLAGQLNDRAILLKLDAATGTPLGDNSLQPAWNEARTFIDALLKDDTGTVYQVVETRNGAAQELRFGPVTADFALPERVLWTSDRLRYATGDWRNGTFVLIFQDFLNNRNWRLDYNPTTDFLSSTPRPETSNYNYSVEWGYTSILLTTDERVVNYYDNVGGFLNVGSHRVLTDAAGHSVRTTLRTHPELLGATFSDLVTHDEGLEVIGRHGSSLFPDSYHYSLDHAGNILRTDHRIRDLYQTYVRLMALPSGDYLRFYNHHWSDPPYLGVSRFAPDGTVRYAERPVMHQLAHESLQTQPVADRLYLLSDHHGRVVDVETGTTEETLANVHRRDRLLRNGQRVRRRVGSARNLVEFTLIDADGTRIFSRSSPCDAARTSVEPPGHVYQHAGGFNLLIPTADHHLVLERYDPHGRLVGQQRILNRRDPFDFRFPHLTDGFLTPDLEHYDHDGHRLARGPELPDHVTLTAAVPHGADTWTVAGTLPGQEHPRGYLARVRLRSERPVGTFSESGFVVSPNPGAGTFRLHYAPRPATDATVDLFDATGRHHAQWTVPLDETGVTPYLWRALRPGRYTVRLRTDGETWTQPWVVY